jgi:hypothetical protein
VVREVAEQVVAGLDDPEGPARPGREPVGVAGEVRDPRQQAASVLTSSVESSLRSMLMPVGVFTAIENTWSATRPSIMRGTST